ncbi:hypothetical protein LguiA_031583 [Lonicera macranthoides]
MATLTTVLSTAVVLSHELTYLTSSRMHMMMRTETIGGCSLLKGYRDQQIRTGAYVGIGSLSKHPGHFGGCIAPGSGRSTIVTTEQKEIKAWFQCLSIPTGAHLTLSVPPTPKHRLKPSGRSPSTPPVFALSTLTFSSPAAKMKNKTEQEIALLRQFDQAWNVYGVLNFLQALVEKSNIIQIFEQEKGPDKLGTQSPLNISHFQDLLINGDLLGYPCSEGLFRLLMSTENTASNILPTTMNLSEHRAFPTYPNMSDYQARLERFSRGSSQVGSVAEVAGSLNLN